jgi:hypothetical protein
MILRTLARYDILSVFEWETRSDLGLQKFCIVSVDCGLVGWFAFCCHKISCDVDG